jgi:DNA polymerase
LIKGIAFDVETYSRLPLRKQAGYSPVGLHTYVNHPQTQLISIAAVAFDAELNTVDKAVFDPHDTPPGFLMNLPDNTLFVAHHAQFDRLNAAQWGKSVFGAQWEKFRWYCTLAHCAYAGVPKSLGDAAIALNLTSQKGDKSILDELKAVVKTKRSIESFRQDIEYMERLRAYNLEDAQVLLPLLKVLLQIAPWPKREREIYQLDQQINARGFALDMPSIKKIVVMGDLYKRKLSDDISALTNGRIDRPSREKEFTKMCAEHGCELPNLQKETIAELLTHDDLDPMARNLLELKQAYASTIIHKYPTMAAYGSVDGRAHWTYTYHGAITAR